ncbi:T9SS type A sorting domain-containing protein [Hymenobacter amundsenii]|uniref:T9SS type A sorting domain-containing protein n=1 Tax=Hymenobacter amundsenii TaxID=2006685 RepID=UPI0013FDA8EA|nr:T9SS type A sorting domain-containing protein [Hymenobacter amundsenii]
MEVRDLTAPTVRTQNISVTLDAAGRATVTAAAIDNGSTDACGVQTLTLDKISFDCSDIGANPVVLTVTDVNGNRASAAATVTVIGATPVPTIVVAKTSTTFTGLDATTIALGYGAQSVVLTASNGTSAAAATTYAWSPAAGLSNSQAANPVFVPTTAGTYTFAVRATNEFGCAASASVTITVLDARCGNNNDKVLVCHKGKTLCVAASAVPAQLAQPGNTLAACGPVLTNSDTNALVGSGQSATVFETFPNPVTTRAVVHFQSAATAAAQVQVFNALGQVVATLYDAVAQAGRDYEVTLEAATLPAGIYTCRLLTNGTVATKRLVVVK